MMWSFDQMRFWWVNQNQTFRQEIAGGYLWSPKRNRGNRLNPFYETMREVAPGDVVFSFVDTRIAAIGIAQSNCWESPKPMEFGTVGEYWEDVGWKVRVYFTPLIRLVRPADHMGILGQLLPEKYSPLQRSGKGNQGVYLAALPQNMAEVLVGLIGPEAQLVMQEASLVNTTVPPAGDDLDLWEHKLENLVLRDPTIQPTEKESIIRARRGQGVFKQRVLALEKQCRITGVERIEHLVASHCKPWRDASNEERLDGENGLLLTPSIDHLFDRGFIGFEDNGTLIISPVAHRPSLQRMGVETVSVLNVGGFSKGQRRFLDYHRDSVLLRALR
jgi:putative restriction endonuclease